MKDRSPCEACNTLEAYWEAKARAQEAMRSGLRDEIEDLQRRQPSLSDEDKERGAADPAAVGSEPEKGGGSAQGE